MFKVGEEVLIRATIKEFIPRDMMYLCELKTGPELCIRFGSPAECIAGKTYSDGLSDAWELAKKLANSSSNEFAEIFGAKGLYSIVCCFSYEEALAKIEAYEKEKEIKVGDVVEDEEGTKALVIDEATENTYFVFTENGCVEDWYKMDLKKTGNKISIESLLRQIGE